MDVLSEIISSVHISGSALSVVECGGDWGIDMEAGRDHGGSQIFQGIPFHYIAQGECWLLGLDDPTLLTTGDLVVAPHWPPHALTRNVDSPRQTISELITASGQKFWSGGTLERPLRYGIGDGPVDVRILTGLFSVTGRGATILSSQLPPLMHLGIQNKSTTPQLKMALEFIEYESEAIRPGYVAVADRLMDLLFIQILRSAILQPTSNIGLFLGLADANIGRALEAIHNSPAEKWTVARLAREAALSRTTFAQRFREIVGVTPMQYVSQWRMTIAEDLLTQSDLSIEAIRSQLGFGTSFVFARAFSARCGMSPREFRRVSRNLSQASRQ